jgi:hypothetical protein
MVKHWTNERTDGFAIAVTIDYLSQLEDRLDSMPITRREYADRLGKDPSWVSQVFNSPEKQNPTILSLVEFARALGMKVSIVAYDDHDPDNNNGPIVSEIFSHCWEKLDCPRDLSFTAVHADVKPDNVLVLHGSFPEMKEIDIKPIHSASDGARVEKIA